MFRFNLPSWLAVPMSYLAKICLRIYRLALWVPAVLAVSFIGLSLAFHTSPSGAYRVLAPDSQACSDGPWDVLAQEKIGNDEWQAVDRAGKDGSANDWALKFRCAIQTHMIPGYQPTDASRQPLGDPRPLVYDLAFLEFQEDGNPFLLCTQEDLQAKTCDGAENRPAGTPVRGQLEVLLEHLKPEDKHYIVAFVHGWRHNAQIGDGNVQDLRVYAAHAARFVADRCHWGDARFCNMKTTAVFIGWRGARTDENRLQRVLAPTARLFCGEGPCFLKDLIGNIGTALASFSLFDRKPVSEAVAPAAISALQAIEMRIGLQKALRDEDLAPCDHMALLPPPTPPASPDHCIASTEAGRAHQSRMIVFGHSLGGNLLATALQDELVKQVERHLHGKRVRDAGITNSNYHVEPGDFEPSPLGNLVVLINPAAEASKWTQMQRAVWRHTEMSNADKGHAADVSQGHLFFRDDQRPAIISVTAARDWPPGGLRPIDCAAFDKRIADAKARAAAGKPEDAATSQLSTILTEEKNRLSRSVDYDWATYDLFPAFKFDFRPIATSMQRYAKRLSRRSDDDACAPYRWEGLWSQIVYSTAYGLRAFPFMNTDIEETHTIGHLDPPRSPEGTLNSNHFSGRPLGTTHELKGWDNGAGSAKRKRNSETGDRREVSLEYREVVNPEATCPVAKNWLSEVRRLTIARPASGGHATFWDTQILPPAMRPALHFQHGFELAGIAAITRANDPFWNVRALDNALAEHDGYMLSSFICAMQQLVLDDPTQIPAPYKPPQVIPAPEASPPPRPAKP